jgi:hypothetical protein
MASKDDPQDQGRIIMENDRRITIRDLLNITTN